MEFNFLDTEALTELTSMVLDNVNISRENGSTSSSTSSTATCGGSSLDTLESGGSIWSPAAHNSSGANSYGSSSSPERSFDDGRPSPWSPSYHNNSPGNYMCSTPEKLEGASESNNSWSPSSPINSSNSSSSYTYPSSPPPGLGLLSSIASSTAALSTKQTLQCLKLIQELNEQNGRVPGTADLTAALQQHLISHLLKQQPPSGSCSAPESPPSPPGYHHASNNHHNNHYHHNHHNHNHHHDNLPRPRFHRDHNGGNETTKVTWSGQLPPRNHSRPSYSCKVFLGGVPFEVSLSSLHRTFRAYGNVKIDWPGKEDNPPDPKGYAYLIYENERQVKALLQDCIYQHGKENTWYYKITSKQMRFNSKDVQVIPWALGDSNFVRVHTTKLDPQKTIFVGALHGMINAEGLALIMQELFGGVVYAGIDTDRHKYPIGSARVTFNNHKSFMKAVSAAFVEIRTSKFTKKVQVDPYLEDATCSVCGLQQGPYFCRDLSCFRYFCRTCFEMHHTGDGFKSHRPLMRNASRQQSARSTLNGSL